MSFSSANSNLPKSQRRRSGSRGSQLRPIHVTKPGERSVGSNLLLEMLAFKRPHLSTTEEIFISTFLANLPGYFEDEFGNGIVIIGSSPNILWSCHTDTVHSSGGIQTVAVSPNGYVTSDSDCLGGDNTVGVFLLREMILHDIEGLYLLHRGEELGRLGSNWVAANTPNLLEGIDFAIAFDRRGFDSVITHQLGERTASDKFANQISSLLGMGHKPDNTGLYTDTASYSDLISECTNISAGFQNEHSSKEHVYLPYVEKLRTKLLTTDWGQLQAHRDPKEFSYSYCTEDSLAEVVYRYPDEVGEYLRAIGITVDDLIDFIRP